MRAGTIDSIPPDEATSIVSTIHPKNTIKLVMRFGLTINLHCRAGPTMNIVLQTRVCTAMCDCGQRLIIEIGFIARLPGDGSDVTEGVVDREGRELSCSQY
jgi:hypothetical protein